MVAMLMVPTRNRSLMIPTVVIRMLTLARLL
jgi:hypothetical protein